MTDPSELPVGLDKDGSSRFTIRVTPRAKRNELGGVVDSGGGRTALAVRLAMPPIDGAANVALIEFLARRLDVPKSSIRIVSGETSRLKMVRVDGLTEAALRRLL